MTVVPVVELLRVSTEVQAGVDRAGIASQRSTNLRTCEAFGLSVVESIELVMSGAEIAQTPGMTRVLDAITSGRARGILIAEYSRLFRPDRWSDMIVLQTISDSGAQIYLPSGPIDLQSELGFVQATVNNLLAAMERRRIRERMHRGKEEHRRRGNHVAGGVGVPYAMTWSKEEGWGWAEEAAMVRELFRRFLGGEHNLHQLSRELGIPRSNIRYLLGNPVYSGWRVYDEKRSSTDPGQKVPRRPDEVIRVQLPLEPLVSEEDFALVQQILADRIQRSPRRSRSDTFLYRGMLQCTCGMNVYTAQASRGKHYYYCRTYNRLRRPEGVEGCGNGYMARAQLEEHLDRAVGGRLTDPDVLVSAIETFNASVRASWRIQPVDYAALENRKAQLEEKKGRIIEAYFDAVISKTERDRRLANVAEELGTTERLLDEVAPEAPGAMTEQVVAALVSTFAEWSHVDRGGRRSILEELAPTFTVRKYGVEGVRFPVALLSSGSNSDSHWKTAR